MTDNKYRKASRVLFVIACVLMVLALIFEPPAPERTRTEVVVGWGTFLDSNEHRLADDWEGQPLHVGIVTWGDRTFCGVAWEVTAAGGKAMDRFEFGATYHRVALTKGAFLYAQPGDRIHILDNPSDNCDRAEKSARRLGVADRKPVHYTKLETEK